MEEYSATRLHEYLQAGNTPRLIDVREAWEFEKCKIDGAELMPMRTVQMNLDKLDKDEEIVVICHHGIRSRMVARMLDQLGYNRVINLSSGVAGWAKEVDSQMPTY